MGRADQRRRVLLPRRRRQRGRPGRVLRLAGHGGVRRARRAARGTGHAERAVRQRSALHLLVAAAQPGLTGQELPAPHQRWRERDQRRSRCDDVAHLDRARATAPTTPSRCAPRTDALENDGWSEWSPLSSPEHPLTAPDAPGSAAGGARRPAGGRHVDSAVRRRRPDHAATRCAAVSGGNWVDVTPQGGTNTHTWEDIPNGTDVELPGAGDQPRSDLVQSGQHQRLVARRAHVQRP